MTGIRVERQPLGVVEAASEVPRREAGYGGRSYTQDSPTYSTQSRGARAQARAPKAGPLSGIPVTVKDSFDLAGGVLVGIVPAQLLRNSLRIGCLVHV